MKVIIVFFVILILSLINDIISIDDSNAKTYAKFLKWGRKHNITISNKLDLEFITFNKRYYVAKDEIQEGEVLLSVPLKVILTSDKAILLSSKKLKVNIKEFIKKYYNDDNGLKGVSQSTKEQTVITYAMYRAMESSKGKFIKNYTPFIEMMEENVDNYPVFYTKEEVALMSYTDIGSKVVRSKSGLEEEANLFQQFFNRTIVLEDYLRYRVLIASKSFHFNNQSNIVPFADLFDFNPFNHSAVWNYSESSKEFIITSTKNISKGEVVYLSTPMVPNSKFLLFYGRTFDDNQYIEPYDILYMHPKWKNEENITLDLFDKTYNLANETFINDAFPLYRQLAAVLHMSSSDDSVYILIRKNLRFYLDEYDEVHEKDYYKETLIKENRLNIQRVIQLERGLLLNRIAFLDQIINDREKRNNIKKTDL